MITGEYKEFFELADYLVVKIFALLSLTVGLGRLLLNDLRVSKTISSFWDWLNNR